MRSVLLVTPLLIIAITCFAFITPAAAALPDLDLTATQSLLVEYDPSSGDLSALGTIVLDLALGPRDHVTYVHDRAWDAGGRWRGHDVSVTRYLGGARDLSATIGWRVKIPEEEPEENLFYVLMGWRWGGG